MTQYVKIQNDTDIKICIYNAIYLNINLQLNIIRSFSILKITLPFKKKETSKSMMYIISNIFRNAQPEDLEHFGPDRMQTCLRSCTEPRYSICRGMGTRHNNYVGSFFVRRPRARFTARGVKSHLQYMFTAPMVSAAQIFLLSLTLLNGVAIGAGNLRLLHSFIPSFCVFEFAPSLHSLSQCSVSNELDINSLLQGNWYTLLQGTHFYKGIETVSHRV